MKWKDVLYWAVIVLLVVVFVLILTRDKQPQAERDTLSRIEQYEIVAEEQRLVTEILRLRYEAALIQQKFNPAPQPALPPQIQE